MLRKLNATCFMQTLKIIRYITLYTYKADIHIVCIYSTYVNLTACYMCTYLYIVYICMYIHI